MRIVWRARARADLLRIQQTIVRESPSGSIRVHDAIIRAVGLLEEWPLMARKGRGDFRELIVPRTPYIVIYRPEATQVVIQRVVHTSRKPAE